MVKFQKTTTTIAIGLAGFTFLALALQVTIQAAEYCQKQKEAQEKQEAQAPNQLPRQVTTFDMKNLHFGTRQGSPHTIQPSK